MATDTSKITGAADELSAGLAKGGTAAKTLGAEIANAIAALDSAVAALDGRVDALESGSVTPPEPPIEPPIDGGITTGNYYVATTGSDSNNGTSTSSPFKTIEKAAGVVNAGQTVVVKGGTYTPATILFSRHGTATQPILFVNYGTEVPVIDGVNSSSTVAQVQLNANYTTMRGFEVQNAKQNGIAMWNTVGAGVTGCKVHGCFLGGIYCGGPSGGGSRDNVIRDNTVFNCMLKNKDHALGSAGGWAPAISCQYTDNPLVENNHCYEHWGEGINCNFPHNAKVRNNVIHDCYSVGIYTDNSPNAEISGNFVYWSGDPKWGYLGQGSPDGIRMSRESNDFPMDGLRIFNNIVVATAHGISYIGYMAGGGVQNSKVYNNTLVNSGVQFDADAGTSGNEFKNNIISGNKGASGSVNGWACSNNCWDTNQKFTGTGDVNAAPGFTGTVGALDDTAYKLKSTSPCKQKGVNVKSTVDKDYAEVARPSSGAFTIGSYE